jgi:hypothetical protein
LTSDPRKREFVVEWNGHAWKGTCPQEQHVFSLHKTSPATALRGVQEAVSDVVDRLEIMYD